MKWSQRLAVNIIDLRNVGNRKFSRKYTSPRSCRSVLNVSLGFRCSRADTLRVSVKLAGYLPWNLRNSILVSLPLIHSHLAFHHFLLVMLAFSIEMNHARVFVLTGSANRGTQSPMMRFRPAGWDRRGTIVAVCMAQCPCHTFQTNTTSLHRLFATYRTRFYQKKC